jgi:hypothetical protein
MKIASLVRTISYSDFIYGASLGAGIKIGNKKSFNLLAGGEYQMRRLHSKPSQGFNLDAFLFFLGVGF